MLTKQEYEELVQDNALHKLIAEDELSKNRMALAVIDESLTLYRGRELISGPEFLDVLLDIRGALKG